MRHLVTIRKVLEIIPILNADNIELCKIGGWQCVTKQGEFSVGDLALYFEIDSLLPIKPEFEFLRKSSYKKLEDGTEGFRLRTVKLRKQLSQGLLLPFSLFPSMDFSDTKKDYAEDLGVTLYVPPIPPNLQGEIRGQFPTHLCPKTDEERIQNLPDYLERYKDVSFEVSEKLDGMSCTMIWDGTEFRICSRNLEFKLPNDNLLQVKLAKKYDVESKLRRSGRKLAIQGEICGPKIANNSLKLTEADLFVFHIYDIEAQRYLTPDERTALTLELHLNHVPILTASNPFRRYKDMNELLADADGQSMLAKVNREGVVYKSFDYIEERIITFKVISNAYLLKEATK